MFLKGDYQASEKTISKTILSTLTTQIIKIQISQLKHREIILIDISPKNIYECPVRTWKDIEHQ